MSEHYISVAMCTYNGAKYVAEQLESILNQTHPMEEMAKIDSTHRWKSLALILKCWIRGYYKKYRKKPRGYCLGDIISCFCDPTES